jgi:hypothetical protein
MNLEAEVREIAGRFALAGDLQEVETHSGGHINESFRLTVQREDGTTGILLLQRLNGHVFPNPARVMENIRRVTSHLSASLAAENVPDAERRVLTLVPAADGRLSVTDSRGDCWRLYPFIEGTQTILSVSTTAEAEEGGRAFGGGRGRVQPCRIGPGGNRVCLRSAGRGPVAAGGLAGGPHPRAGGAQRCQDQQRSL